MNNEELMKKILIINYDDLNNEKIKKICDFCELTNFNYIKKYFEKNFYRTKNKINNEITNINDKIKDSIEKEALNIFNKINKLNHTL